MHCLHERPCACEQEVLPPLGCPVVLCHNDVNEGNFLRRAADGKLVLLVPFCGWRKWRVRAREQRAGGRGASSRTGPVSGPALGARTPRVCCPQCLQDYDYAGWNYAAYDIANLFCEAAIDNNTGDFPGFAIDHRHYPSRPQQKRWLRHYLATRQTYPSPKTAETVAAVSDGDVEKWMAWAEKFALSSHLYWTLWALGYSAPEGIEWGYLEYGISRLWAFRALKGRLEQGGAWGR